MGRDILIRQSSADDAAFLARGILMAGRAHVQHGIWEVILGLAERDCLSFLELLAVTETPHLFHHTCYLIAELDAKPAGMAGGYDEATHGQDNLRRAMPEAFQRMGFMPDNSSLAERASRVLPCVPKTIEGSWMIDSVATFPEFRRMGISEKVLSSIMNLGRTGGFNKAQVNMYVGNTPAMALYVKMGFKVASEKACPEFEREVGSPGMAGLIRGM